MLFSTQNSLFDEFNTRRIDSDILPKNSLDIINTQSVGAFKKYKVLSLFSGCGGMDLGFEGGFVAPYKSVSMHPHLISNHINDDWVLVKPTQFSIVFANDILRAAANTWTNYMSRHGYSSSVYHTESIVNLVKQHREKGGVFPDSVDVVVGGFPCQDFSVAGKRMGFNSQKTHDGSVGDHSLPTEESRGRLYCWMKEVIEITKPKMFIAENVKGLVNLGEIKDIIQKDFASASNNGYYVFSPQVLHAGNYGVPQSRERVFFIGVRRDALKKEVELMLLQNNIPHHLNPYPSPTHNCTVDNSSLADPLTLGDVFKDLKEPQDTNDPSQFFYSKAKYMGSHCQGQKEVTMDGIGPTIRAEHHGNIEFRRLSLVNNGQNVSELNEGLQERRLTPRECALIQTFPPDFQFVIPKDFSWKSFWVSASSAYKVIGNAVPPILAYKLAIRVQDLWDTFFES